MILITGSIVLYQNDELILEKAISSFLTSKFCLKLFLVDNSPDNSLSKLAKNSRIVYIHNPSNPGFGASHNIAIQKALDCNADYHLVLNPDIYFTEGEIEKIVKFMETDDQIGLLMPKILYPDGSYQFLCKRNPTFLDLFLRGFLSKSLKRYFQKREDYFLYKSMNLEDTIYNIPYLSGCFMFFRVKALKTVGFFDEKFFMYLEDADITRRVLHHFKTVYYPDVIVFHHYAGLTHKKLKFKLITIRSAITYFNKWGWINHLK